MSDMGFIVMESTECIICKKSFNSSSNNNTYFCRVCDDIQGSVCRTCRKAGNLVCPKCGMPLQQKEDPTYEMGGMY